MAARHPLFVHVMRHGLVHNPREVYYGRLPRFRLADRGVRQAEQGATYLVTEAMHASQLRDV